MPRPAEGIQGHQPEGRSQEKGKREKDRGGPPLECERDDPGGGENRSDGGRGRRTEEGAGDGRRLAQEEARRGLAIGMEVAAGERPRQILDGLGPSQRRHLSEIEEEIEGGHARLKRRPGPEDAERRTFAPEASERIEEEGHRDEERGKVGQDRQEEEKGEPGDPGRRPRFERAFELGERGGREKEEKAVSAHLGREGQERRRKGDEEEGHEARGPSAEAPGPTPDEPQGSDAEDGGQRAQEELRIARAHPEVEEQEEERRMREKPAVLIDADEARRVRRLQVERLVGAQIPVPRRGDPDRQDEGDRDKRREIAVMTGPLPDGPSRRHVTSDGRPCQRRQAAVARISSIAAKARSSSRSSV